MKMPDKIKEVAFADENLKKEYLRLKESKSEERQLFDLINRAIDDLKRNPLRGVKIPEKLIPKEYVKKYKINNLRKYNLPNAWRLIYTLTGNEIKIVSIIIEWLNHKGYERRFGYA